MASYSKSVFSYTDVHQLFEKAGRDGSVSLEFVNTAAAVTFVSRANAYRVLLRNLNEQAGRLHACDFDHLQVRRPQKSNIVKIEPKGYDFKIIEVVPEQAQLSKVTLPDGSLLPHQLSEAEAEAAAFLDAFERGEIK